MTMRLKLLACTALSAAALIAPAAAQSGDKAKIDRLERRVEQLEALVDRLTDGGRRAPAAAAAPAPAVELEQRVSDLEIAQSARIAKLEEKAATDPAITFKNARPVFSTPDGKFTMAIRGRFHFDAGIYDQDPGRDVPYAVDGGNVRDLGSGSYFRRAQFGVEGKVFRDFDYEFRFNFGGSETEEAGSINIMRVAYNPTPDFRINIGAIQPTFTMDDSTSSNEITFLERASVVNALISEFGGSDARKGIEMTYLNKDAGLMINAAYTTAQIGSARANDDRDHLLGRIAWRPYTDDDIDVHLGVNAATILSMGGTDVSNASAALAARNLNFRDRPELRIGGERLVATGSIPAEGAWMYGLEAAFRYQSFYLQGEYFGWEIERDRECANCNAFAPDPDFEGYYIQGSYILTGETKKYTTQAFSNSRMVFGAPVPKQNFNGDDGWGAFELAARYSVLDLNYNVGPEGTPRVSDAGEIRGGEQEILSVALNWYLNPNVRVMFQYQDVNVERLSSTALDATTNPGIPSSAYPDIGQSYDTYAVRTQFAF